MAALTSLSINDSAVTKSKSCVGVKMTRAQELPVSMRSTVVATEDHVSSNLGGEAVILGLSSGVYYGLDVVGSRIWGI